LNGVDTTGNQTLLDAVTASGPPDPAFVAKSDFVSKFNKHKWVIIGVIIGVGVLLIALATVVLCRCRRDWRRRRVSLKIEK
jgi:hypothetical protein